jgi:GNAT superfamily N-acetyltransferase
VRLQFRLAEPADAAELASLRGAAADALTGKFGEGHWSGNVSERGVISGLRHAQVWVAIADGRIVGTFRLATKKPWAIDRGFFTPVKRPLYLTDMAVLPDLQRKGVGRACLLQAVEAARAFPANSICLDAYDAVAGAGDFYAKCGFREAGRVAYRGVPLIYYEMIINSEP